MSTKDLKGLFTLGLSLGQIVALEASVFYVAPPPLGSDDGPGTEAQPFATIQKGIDTAAEGDTVIAAAGTCFENITFGGKDLVVRSIDADDTNVVAHTVIDGDSATSVVTFSGTETPSCVLEGLTIQHGCPDFETGGYGGGICGGSTNLHTRATIRNNIIWSNWSTYGGGLAFCDGEVVNNRILLDGAYPDGGGQYDCDGTIQIGGFRGKSDCPPPGGQRGFLSSGRRGHGRAAIVLHQPRADVRGLVSLWRPRRRSCRSVAGTESQARLESAKFAVNPEPRQHVDYSPRQIEAARRVLVDLGQVLAAFEDCLVVVGGWVPDLLLEQADELHVGSIDVDLALDANKLTGGRYADLLKLLLAG